MARTHNTAPKWRGRLIIPITDQELRMFKGKPLGTRGIVLDAEARVGNFVWLCHGIAHNPTNHRVGWMCAAVVMACDKQHSTVMLIGPPATNVFI